MTAVSMSGFGYTTPRSHLKLTKRGRAVFTTLAAVPLVIAAFIFALNGGGASATFETAQPGVEYTYVSVVAGQSSMEPGGRNRTDGRSARCCHRHPRVQRNVLRRPRARPAPRAAAAVRGLGRGANRPALQQAGALIR